MSGFTVESQLLYYQAYKHKEKDERDVQLLCRAYQNSGRLYMKLENKMGTASSAALPASGRL